MRGLAACIDAEEEPTHGRGADGEVSRFDHNNHVTRVSLLSDTIWPEIRIPRFFPDCKGERDAAFGKKSSFDQTVGRPDDRGVASLHVASTSAVDCLFVYMATPRISASPGFVF